MSAPICFVDAIEIRFAEKGSRRRLNQLGSKKDHDFVQSFLVQLSSRILSVAPAPFLRDKLRTGLNQAIKADELVAPRASLMDAPASSKRDAEQSVLNEFFREVEGFLNRQDYDFALPQEVTQVYGVEVCSRFLFCHRFIDHEGNLRIRLHLLEKQRLLSERILEKLRPISGPPNDDIARELTQRLGPMLADIDTAFTKGVSSWVSWPETEKRGQASNSVRQWDLGDLFAPFLKISTQQLPPALLIPVHVGGLPWLALIGFCPEAAEERRDWGYSLYRDLLPYLTTTIRQMAERAYLEALRIDVRGLIDVRCKSPDKASRALRQLTTVFPYPEIALLPQHNITDDDEGVPFSWFKTPIRLTIKPNTEIGGNSSRVKYRLIGVKAIRGGFEAALSEAEANRASVLAAEIGESRAWAHDVTNSTVPPIEHLSKALGAGTLREDDRTDIRLALQWNVFLHCAATVRDQVAGRSGSGGVRRPAKKFLALAPRDRMTLVELVLLYLLACHRDANEKYFKLVIYRSGRIVAVSAANIADRLDRFVRKHDGGRSRLGGDLAAFGSELVAWPMAFLREIVQNITTQQGSGLSQPTQPEKIAFSFLWKLRRGSSLLLTTQRQLTRAPWNFGEAGLSPGLLKTNMVYGKSGAGFAQVERRELTHQPVRNKASINISQRYLVTYGLDVRFLSWRA